MGSHYQRTHLIKAVAEHCDGLIATQPHERGQQLQLLVCADADALPPDGVHLVLAQQECQRQKMQILRGSCRQQVLQSAILTSCKGGSLLSHPACATAMLLGAVHRVQCEAAIRGCRHRPAAQNEASSPSW